VVFGLQESSMASVRILGCSGGAFGGLRSTALLVNQDTLVDCGSGVGDLALQEMLAVQQVLLTHSHLDHTMFLPLLADATLASRTKPLLVYALPETLHALRLHMFSGALWPDYTSLPDPAAPYIQLSPIRLGETLTLSDCRYTPLPARHSIPAVGYWLEGASGSLVFSGDSGDCPGFWEAANSIANLRYVMIETTMRNEDAATAELAGHTTPRQLALSAGRLKRKAELLVTHMEPDKRETIQAQVRAALGARAVHFVERGETYSL
jgi:ribonuclease BN (tRNA processing enzyme)